MTDTDAMFLIQTAIRATGLFSAVLAGRNPPELDTTAASFPQCWLTLKGFKERSLSDPECKQRDVTFTAVITIQSDHSTTGEVGLDSLANSLSNALESATIPGLLPALSTFTAGDYPPAFTPPFATLQLTGGFSYLVDGFAGRSLPNLESAS